MIMKQLSNNDYALALRLLYALSKTKGETVRERENARKAFILHKKLIRKDAKNNGDRDTRQPGGNAG